MGERPFHTGKVGWFDSPSAYQLMNKQLGVRHHEATFRIDDQGSQEADVRASKTRSESPERRMKDMSSIPPSHTVFPLIKGGQTSCPIVPHSRTLLKQNEMLLSHIRAGKFLRPI